MNFMKNERKNANFFLFFKQQGNPGIVGFRGVQGQPGKIGPPGFKGNRGQFGLLGDIGDIGPKGIVIIQRFCLKIFTNSKNTVCS